MRFLKTMILSTVAIAGMAFSQVNINTATVEELSALSGIGPKKAEAIIKYRRAHGKFQSVSDLTNVAGIGDVTVSNLGRNIKTSGHTDLTKLSKTKAVLAKKTKTSKDVADKGKKVTKSKSKINSTDKKTTKQKSAKKASNKKATVKKLSKQAKS